MTVRVALGALVYRFGGSCAAPLDREVTGFAALDEATSEQLAFVSQPRFRASVPSSRAAAILVTAKDAEALAPEAARLWICKDPYLHFARIAQWFSVHVLGRIERDLPCYQRMSRLAPFLGRDLLGALFKLERGGERAPFDIPDHLARSWALPA